jgi:hypothetical protein
MKHFHTSRIGKKIKIKYYFVDTNTIEEIWHKDNPDDNTVIYGLFLPIENRIYINEDQEANQIELTIIHETIEALNYYYKLKLNHDQISVLEFALFDFDFDVRSSK